MKISIIIPTLNEERNLPDAINRLRATSERAEIEIIVADSQSTDQTMEIARALADQALEIPHRGRACQMHQGALAASGELLLFLHADTRLPDGWRAALGRAWSSGHKPAATAFRLGFESQSLFYRFLAGAANFRTAWTGVPQGDQAIAVRRDVYLQVGGFPPVPLMEEYMLLAKLAKLGQVKIIPDSVTTSVRRYEKNGRIFNALRNSFIVALFYLGFSPRFLARLYR